MNSASYFCMLTRARSTPWGFLNVASSSMPRSSRANNEMRRSAPPGHGEDQGDAAIAQDRRAGDPVDLLEVRLEALHHHLLLAEELVDEECRQAVLVLDDHHQALGGVDGAWHDVEQAVQADQR